MSRGISVMGTKKTKRTAASTVGGLRKAAGEVTRGTVSAGETLPGGTDGAGRDWDGLDRARRGGDGSGGPDRELWRDVDDPGDQFTRGSARGGSGEIRSERG